MIEIELGDPIEPFVCECCGGKTYRLTRFVYQDGDAFAVYYAKYSDMHPDQGVEAIISLGEWGEGSTPQQRKAFAVILFELDDAQMGVQVKDARESAWHDVEIIGQKMSREEALADPWIKDAFHITDHMFADDPAIKAFFTHDGDGV